MARFAKGARDQLPPKKIATTPAKAPAPQNVMATTMASAEPAKSQTGQVRGAPKGHVRY